MSLELKVVSPKGNINQILKSLTTVSHSKKTDWVLYDIEFTTLENQNTLKIEFVGEPNKKGVAWLDEVSLIEIE